MSVLAANQGEQLQPVHGWKAQIRDHHIGAIHQLQRLFGRPCLIHLKARRDQVQLDHPAQLLFIVDNQNPLLHFRRGK